LRCLALAQAWKETGGDVVFRCAELPAPIKERVLAEGIQIEAMNCRKGSEEDATQLCAAAREHTAAWLVVDGYQFGPGYQHTIHAAGHPFLFIDDVGNAEHYYADVVLNQNGGVHEDLYRRKEPNTDLLLGPRFVLLRREFLAYKSQHRVTPSRAEKLLVTFGGADPHNTAAKTVAALESIAASGLRTTILIGANHPSRRAIEDAISRASLQAEVVMETRKMPEFLLAADLAICAPGTTCWEMAFFGLPMITIAVATNQLGNGQFLNETGLARHLGWHAEIAPAEIATAIQDLAADQPTRHRMSLEGPKLVDGQGAFRVCQHLDAK
jgi:UDP-2,4-diacetamido-2,4,6-trideoxy-beta-L-altropyranose hydrolase